MRRRCSRRSPGFTLLELMLVLAVIGTLLLLAIPKLGSTIRIAKEGATSPLEWGEAAARCAFIVLMSLMVNELSAEVRAKMPPAA